MARTWGRLGTRSRLGLLAGVAAVAAVAVAIPVLAGSVLTSSGFEADDGNLVNGPAAGIDWNSFDPVTWNGSTTTPPTPTRVTDEKTVSGYTFKGIEDWQNTTSDSGFGGGTKQDEECPDVITAKAPNKDDLRRIYLASGLGSDGDTYLQLAWVRIPQNAPSPSAHVAFEFNKGDTDCSGPGGLVERTLGDMLIVYDFGGGEDVPTITMERWLTTSGTCEIGSHDPPCWGEAVDLTALDPRVAEARVNTTSVGTVLDQLAPPALSAQDADSVDQQLGLKQFGEAGINLTDAGVFTPGQCEGFGTASAVSRTSGSDDSDNAQMKDLVGPTDFTINNCADINIHKEDDAGNPLEGAVFTLFTDNAPLDGSPPHGAEDTVTTFTCTTDADGDCTITGVPPGQYWVVETTTPAGHTTAPDQNVTVSVGSDVSLEFENPRQHKVIVLVCHQGTNTLAASDVSDVTSPTTTSLAEGATLPEGVSEAELCGLGGATYSDLPHGNKGFRVDVGSDAHPPPSP